MRGTSTGEDTKQTMKRRDIKEKQTKMIGKTKMQKGREKDKERSKGECAKRYR